MTMLEVASHPVVKSIGASLPLGTFWTSFGAGLLIAGSAVAPILHLCGWFFEFRTERRVRLMIRIRPAVDTQGRAGIQVWMHNTGGVTLNVDWMIIETKRASWQLSLHANAPIARLRVQSVAVSWRDLEARGVMRGDAIRVRVAVDLGKELCSRRTVVPSGSVSALTVGATG